MAFIWKDSKDKFKGEGIYFLTFNVNNRVPLLGKLKPMARPDAEGHIAMVEATELGKAVNLEFNALQGRYAGFKVLGKQIMEDHFHAVCWCKEEFGDESIKMVARGFAQSCSKVARRLAQAKRQEEERQAEARQAEAKLEEARLAVEWPAEASGLAEPSVPAQSNCAETNGTAATTAAPATNAPTATTPNAPAAATPSTPTALSPYDCGNGANTLFEKPFIRTLSHAGQLRRMIDYTHNNPDNAWMRRQNPQLYVIRRGHEYAGLQFDLMGKERLLAYPDRQVIALSRSLTTEQIDHEVQKALLNAECGTITYTAAINEGERRVARAIREAGCPLVIMMLDGFPPEGSDAARYYHPGGVYHKICGEGRLCLMAPRLSCYNNATLIALTEQELALKASKKGQRYTGMPHTTTRWRMIAGNMMLRMIGEE